jgi:Holliday junction resolvase RusA-like endonuclease
MQTRIAFDASQMFPLRETALRKMLNLEGRVLGLRGEGNAVRIDAGGEENGGGKRMTLSFTILGTPLAKQGDRTFRRGNFIGHYQPKVVLNYCDSVRCQVAQAMMNAGISVIDGAVELILRFYFSKPKSRQRKATAGIDLKKTTRPDLDNLEKALLDGLKGILFRDDAQVWKVAKEKWETDGQARSEIQISWE